MNLKSIFCFSVFVLVALACGKENPNARDLSLLEQQLEKSGSLGAIYLDGILYRTLTQSNYYYTGPNYYFPDAPRSIHSGLFYDTETTFFKDWGAVQITGDMTTHSTWRVSKIIVYLPELSENGMGVIISQLGSVTKIEKDSSQAEFPSNLIKSYFVKTYTQASSSLTLSLRITTTSGHTIDVVYNGDSTFIPVT